MYNKGSVIVKAIYTALFYYLIGAIMNAEEKENIEEQQTEQTETQQADDHTEEKQTVDEANKEAELLESTKQYYEKKLEDTVNYYEKKVETRDNMIKQLMNGKDDANKSKPSFIDKINAHRTAQEKF